MHFGSDALAALCEDLDDAQAALVLAECVQVALGEPCRLGGNELVTRASIGIATAGAREQAAEELMRAYFGGIASFSLHGWL